MNIYNDVWDMYKFNFSGYQLFVNAFFFSFSPLTPPYRFVLSTSPIASFSQRGKKNFSFRYLAFWLFFWVCKIKRKKFIIHSFLFCNIFNSLSHSLFHFMFISFNPPFYFTTQLGFLMKKSVSPEKKTHLSFHCSN